MSAVPLKLQFFQRKTASLRLRQALCRLRGRYGKILLTEKPLSFFQLGSYRIGDGISGSHLYRILWGSCVRTLSVIAVGYILSQKNGFVKGK